MWGYGGTGIKKGGRFDHIFLYNYTLKIKTIKDLAVVYCYLHQRTSVSAPPQHNVFTLSLLLFHVFFCVCIVFI